MASSVASTVARKKGFRLYSDRDLAVIVLVVESYAEVVVEKAMKRSPEPLSPFVPVRPMPKAARLATRFS